MSQRLGLTESQLATVDFNASNIITSTYDAGLRESTRTFGNGLVTTMSYNLDNTKAGISVAGRKRTCPFNYTYDANKNVTAETSTGTVMDLYDWSASFDDIDRVTSWDRTDAANPDSQNWTLDKIGNWGNTTGTLGGNAFNENRTHNDVHELTNMAGQTLAYDDKGNMTTDANGNSLTWDIDNHLVSFNSVTFAYDALGRRLEKSDGTNSTLFICDGQRVVEEYTSSGGAYTLQRSYVYGTYVDDIVAKIENNSGFPTLLYYHSDRQFNVRGLTDDAATPNIVELYAYSVYGKQTVMDSSGTVIGATAEDNYYGFTGRYLDTETGLWYFRARYFSNELGRFISRDPLGYVDGMSLYNGYFTERFALDPMGKESIGFSAVVKVIPKLIRNWNVPFGSNEYVIGKSASPLGGCYASSVGKKTIHKSFEANPLEGQPHYSLHVDVSYFIEAKGKNHGGKKTCFTGAINISFGERSFFLYKDRMNFFHRFDISGFNTSINISTCEEQKYCLCAEGQKDISVQFPVVPEELPNIREGDLHEVPDGDDGFMEIPREIPEGTMTYGIRPKVILMGSIWREDD